MAPNGSPSSGRHRGPGRERGAGSRRQRGRGTAEGEQQGVGGAGRQTEEGSSARCLLVFLMFFIDFLLLVKVICSMLLH